MKKQVLLFSDKANKIKSKLLVLSGVSLFIGLTKALPENFSFISMDLSHNPAVLGWFIFYITLCLLLIFITVSALDITENYLPHFTAVPLTFTAMPSD